MAPGPSAIQDGRDLDPSKSKRRTRAVNFRVSEEEFQELKKACATQGARSVSEFARKAVWRMVVGVLGPQLKSGAENIEDGLTQIQQQLSELAALIRESGKRAAPEEPAGEIDRGAQSCTR